MDGVEFAYCPSLKLEIQNLKGQLTELYKLPSIDSMSPSDKGQGFKKNVYILGKIEKIILLKLCVIIIVKKVI